MKIDKEKFNKLKQLDRIEFRQKYRNINERGSNLWDEIWALLIIVSIFGTVGLVSGYISFLDIASLFLRIALIMIVLEIMFFIVGTIFKHKRTKELEEEYFSIEVKKK